MKTRREFLANTMAAAALVTNSSGQTLALSELSTVDDAGNAGQQGAFASRNLNLAIDGGV